MDLLKNGAGATWRMHPSGRVPALYKAAGEGGGGRAFSGGHTGQGGGRGDIYHRTDWSVTRGDSGRTAAALMMTGHGVTAPPPPPPGHGRVELRASHPA